MLEQDPAVHDDMVWAFLSQHEQYATLRWMHAVRMRKYATAAELLSVDADTAPLPMDKKVSAGRQPLLHTSRQCGGPVARRRPWRSARLQQRPAPAPCSKSVFELLGDVLCWLTRKE